MSLIPLCDFLNCFRPLDAEDIKVNLRLYHEDKCKAYKVIRGCEWDILAKITKDRFENPEFGEIGRMPVFDMSCVTGGESVIYTFWLEG